ncbi:regulatory protein RecX [Rhizobium sp. AAP43]|uniref:regulatory protein RecX n=1 Tax=Rhizobium sp. AAP43 TaxID=1523420 RepID=UPI0006B8F187|nr:regulatory protein RecX [Rhizobium sp. AAP43]KPF41338.1 RecX family transcriptional regulator [Rhizobium sp. AAP43]
MDDIPTSDELPTARMLTWVRNSAAYRLARRMMTEKELADAIRRKAKSKFEDITEAQVAALAEAAIAFGRSMSALDDRAYAEIRAGSAARGGKSKRAVARKLSEKGVEAVIITEILAEQDDLRPAVVYARKKAFGPFRRVPADEKQVNREMASFARQGYGFDLIRRVLEMTRDEAEEVLAS